MCSNTLPRPLRSLAELQHVVVVLILPTIQQYGRSFFRSEHNHSKKEEIFAEMQALGWSWCLRLNEQGMDPAMFKGTLAILLSRAVCSGRRLCGQDKDNDIMSPLAQQRNGFRVQPLPPHETSGGDNGALDALQDTTLTLPPDQAAFRHDLLAWIRTHTPRVRRIIYDLMLGERTTDVASKFGATPGRIDQMRRELCADWQRFCDN